MNERLSSTTVASIDPTLECICDYATEAEALAFAKDLATELGVAEVHHSVLGWEVWA